MRLVDADAVYELHSNYPAFARSYADLTDLRDILDDAPTIEAEPVKHGRWMKDVNGFYYCPYCVGVSWTSPDVPDAFKRCPNCGARMDGSKDATTAKEVNNETT